MLFYILLRQIVGYPVSLGAAFFSSAARTFKSIRAAREDLDAQWRELTL